ncbi:MAG: cobaltochelatase subunit CobS, partial [Pseudomonadota bacterium]
MATIAEDVVFPEPDITVPARETFGVDIDLAVPAFSEASEYSPPID